MNVETKVYLRRKFSEYYARHKVPAPLSVEKREFGFGTLTEKIKTRHRSFRSDKELEFFLKREAPYYISYSVAYYDYPENPMNEKVWRGAELVFDLDMDMKFLSHEKLEDVKRQALSLVEYLTKDFGVLEGDMKINFSGSKGYHIHVLNESVKMLGKDERREIVDYMTGGVSFKDYLREDGDSRDPRIVGPSKSDAGWRGRIFRGVHDYIMNADQKALMEIEGIGEKKAEQILKRKEDILKALEEGRYDTIPEVVQIERSKKSTGDSNVKDYAIENVKSPIIGNIIKHLAIHMEAEDTDKMVTIDTSRLIRLPDTIHGGSGLVAKTVRGINDLVAFDPLREALAFGSQNVRAILNEDVPEFDLGGVKQGPFTAGDIEVPEYVAVYLMLKGKADVPGQGSNASVVSLSA